MNIPITVGYTIFNKAHLIPQIIDGIKECFSPQDEILFLFDNCTDDSLERFTEVALKEWFTNVLVFSSGVDLFEVKANNKILEQAKNEVIILFQDDMICRDPMIKNKISKVMSIYGDDLGLLGGRDGFELKVTPFPEQPIDKISSWSHHSNTELLEEYKFDERTFLNRGPLVFTKKLLKEVGYLDEAYYPLWGDDMDYCARAKFIHGKKNVVFQCNIQSNLEWGTTRSGSTIKKQLPAIMRKNWDLFISRWGKYLK